ncbi:MAG TPA: head GIN domain-containing protein [Gaiellaceae bacterium]|nr:head GIN domain-containing protein [Gaiellaceae bacterium]
MRVCALVLLAVLAAGCSSHSTTKGSGHVVSVSRGVSGFTRIDFEGTGTVTVSVGKSAGLTMRGEDNILPLITTDVIDGELVISSKRSYSTHRGLDIRISTPALGAVKLGGTGAFVARGIRATDFTVDLQGTSTLVLAGTAGRLDADVSGVGSADLRELATRDAHVKLSGTGSVLVNVAETLDASVDGVGSILYSGHPRRVRTHVSGLGSITGA